MAGRGNGSRKGTAGGGKKRNRERQEARQQLKEFRSAFADGVKEATKKMAAESTKSADNKPDLSGSGIKLPTKGGYQFGQQHRSTPPGNLPIKGPQTLSPHDGNVPKSNAEGIKKANEELERQREKEERSTPKPKQPNQMDETNEGRSGGTYGTKPRSERLKNLYKDEVRQQIIDNRDKTKSNLKNRIRSGFKKKG